MKKRLITFETILLGCFCVSGFLFIAMTVGALEKGTFGFAGGFLGLFLSGVCWMMAAFFYKILKDDLK